jgi:archaellum component FlaC
MGTMIKNQKQEQNLLTNELNQLKKDYEKIKTKVTKYNQHINIYISMIQYSKTVIKNE